MFRQKNPNFKYRVWVKTGNDRPGERSSNHSRLFKETDQSAKVAAKVNSVIGIENKNPVS